MAKWLSKTTEGNCCGQTIMIFTQTISPNNKTGHINHTTQRKLSFKLKVIWLKFEKLR